jgi:hypothetical protein
MATMEIIKEAKIIRVTHTNTKALIQEVEVKTAKIAQMEMMEKEINQLAQARELTLIPTPL